MAGGVAAALVRRARTGQGAVVDVSLLSSGMWASAPGIIASQLYGVDTIPRRSHLDQPNPLVTAYTTSDGRQIYMSGIQTEKNFPAFAQIVGHPELVDDVRFATGPERLANARECISTLDGIFRERDLAEWVERFRVSPMPWAIVQTSAEAAVDPQTVANGYVIAVEGDAGSYPVVASPAQFDGVRPTAQRAPEHGEHTELVLMSLGRDWDTIARLKSEGTVN
jgi:crotonobetainyl-CoA:carnitine CoA-transferase CaiB-like acyl-CoA transferase